MRSKDLIVLRKHQWVERYDMSVRINVPCNGVSRLLGLVGQAVNHSHLGFVSIKPQVMELRKCSGDEPR